MISNRIKKPPIIIYLLPLVLLLMASCSTVRITHNYPDYISMKLQDVRPEFLMSQLILDDEVKTVILPEPMTVAEFIAYMMLAKPIDTEAYLTVDVSSNNQGGQLIFHEYKRGGVILKLTLDLVYQEGFVYSRVDRIIWNDKMMGQKQELVTLEEKAGFAGLVAFYLAIQ